MPFESIDIDTYSNFLFSTNILLTVVSVNLKHLFDSCTHSTPRLISLGVVTLVLHVC